MTTQTATHNLITIPPRPDREIIKCVMDIIKGYMNLDDQHCYIYNQKWLIPADKNLYVVIGYSNKEVVGNTLKYRRTVEELIGINAVMVQEDYFIEMYSYSDEARTRQLELIAAFGSDLSVRTQEKFQFQFGEVPINFSDVSRLEASKILNRYHSDIRVLYGRTFEKSSPYWNQLGGLKTIINN